MGLWDRKGRAAAELPEHYVELVRRVGRSEAEVERLGLIWVGYRDEIRRLVQRLEKRDQRLEKRQEEDCEDCPEAAPLDTVSARILARRRRVSGVPQRNEG